MLLLLLRRKWSSSFAGNSIFLDIDSDVYVLVFADYGIQTKEALNGLCPKEPRKTPEERDLQKVLTTVT